MLDSGQRYEKFVRYPKGDPENPLTWDELAAKFRSLAGAVLSPERCNDDHPTDLDADARRTASDVLLANHPLPQGRGSVTQRSIQLGFFLPHRVQPDQPIELAEIHHVFKPRSGALGSQMLQCPFCGARHRVREHRRISHHGEPQLFSSRP